MTSSEWVLALDAGTTGVRSRAVFADGAPGLGSYRELTQHFPQPGWVEHDAEEIWAAALATIVAVIEQVGAPPATIGITNQRETVVAWDRTTGRPYGRAIVWQDRRTAHTCEQMERDGHLPLVREHTGLVLDPYFSASKMHWMLANGVPRTPALAFGTIDSWLLWNLTGGEVFATDPSNASRTMLFDIRSLTWSDELLDLFGVTLGSLPEVHPSSGHFGDTARGCGAPAGIPISGIAGDQQAALFGQCCVRPGMAKNTYGTGSFVLMNVGGHCPPPADGLLTTVAWTLADGSTTYALEGSIFVTGAAVQWLRDGLQVIERAAEIGPLAASVTSTDGVYVVPAFTGLGSPWWEPHARGTIVGITRGSGRAQIARAVVESMAYQTRDAVDAMVGVAGLSLDVLRVDGGASAMDLLLQLQADQLGVPVLRPVDLETTSLGAAFLAGLAEGVWPSLDALESTWRLDIRAEPCDDRAQPDALYDGWLRAVERSLV